MRGTNDFIFIVFLKRDDEFFSPLLFEKEEGIIIFDK